MKAVTPVRPQDSSSSSSSSTTSSTSSGSQPSLHYLSKQSLNIARCRMEEEDLLCLQYDMNDCYTRLKRLVPTIPQDKKVSRVEILQHVIDYILDLQLALETHPSLHKQQPLQSCPPPASSNPGRTPLTVLNIDHHQVSFCKPTGTVRHPAGESPGTPVYCGSLCQTSPTTSTSFSSSTSPLVRHRQSASCPFRVIVFHCDNGTLGGLVGEERRVVVG